MIFHMCYLINENNIYHFLITTKTFYFSFIYQSLIYLQHIKNIIMAAEKNQFMFYLELLKKSEFPISFHGETRHQYLYVKTFHVVLG